MDHTDFSIAIPFHLCNPAFLLTFIIKKRSPGRIPGRSHKKPKLLLYEKNFRSGLSLMVNVSDYHTKKRTEQTKKMGGLANGSFSYMNSFFRGMSCSSVPAKGAGITYYPLKSYLNYSTKSESAFDR